MTGLDRVDLVLASTSRYRRELLTRIAPRFRVVAPQVDETPQANEAPAALAIRLADAKACAVAALCPGALVIGSDQVADLDGKILEKPGNVETARSQLAASSGRQVIFHTAICLLDARVAPISMATRELSLPNTPTPPSGCSAFQAHCCGNGPALSSRCTWPRIALGMAPGGSGKCLH